MAIPDGTMYHDGHLGAGTVERQYEVLTEIASADIPFGAGVSLQLLRHLSTALQ